MKDFSGLVLYEQRSEWVDVHVRANLTDGVLSVSGHDLGPCVEKVWGDDDYECWYSFDREETAKLAAVIHGETDLAAALLREFSGERGCRLLETVCKKHGIRYQFSSYV